MKDQKHRTEQEAELQSLINAVLEETAAERDLSRLGEFLEEHPHLIAQYADHLVIDTHLSWDALGDVIQLCATAPSEKSPTSLSSPASREPSGSAIWMSKRWMSGAAIAGGLMLLIYCFGIGPASGVGDTLAHVSGFVPHGSATLRDGDSLGPGVFRLSDGESATLNFCSGPQLYCEGPCKLDLVSPKLVSLAHGKVTADVPTRAIGFTVLTKRLQVTDLGTRFGVDVDANEEVDVVVFDGEVNLSDRQGRSEVKGLYAGEALRFGHSADYERLVSIGHDPSSTTWASNWQTDTTLRRSVFTSVTDNLALDSEPNFYGVVPRGMVEDARAYSDRPHEWNSLPGQPLPEWLHGADLIRRFNSRKYEHSSQLEVSLSMGADCMLYVFWDTRCEPLAWLQTHFKSTGYVLGMDEGPYRGDNTVAVGAGKSIDTTYEVWAAKAEANEVFRLGVLGNEGLGDHKNLYGIAAKPIERISPEFFPLLFD